MERSKEVRKMQFAESQPQHHRAEDKRVELELRDSRYTLVSSQISFLSKCVNLYNAKYSGMCW